MSPYLFGILMTVIMEDVENGLTELEREGLRQGTPQRTGINKVFYADDTILLTTTKQSMENLLHSIERESAKYNMRLNKQKCVVLNMNEIMRVEYSDGTQVPVKSQAVYLGAIITKKSEYKPELNHRIAATARVMKSLNKLWINAPVSTKWKIRVFDAVCVAKLTYGLETLPITPEACKKLDAFYYKSLRRITGIPPAHISHISNLTVLETANERAQLKDGKLLTSITQRVKEKQIKLFGHLLRANPTTDHTRRIAIDEQGYRVRSHTRRIGRPRLKWYDMAKQAVIENFTKQNIILRQWERHMRYDELNPIIVEAAQERLF